MPYSASEFSADMAKAARSLHLSYRRSQFLLTRWFSGINTSQTWDDATTNLMSLMQGVVEDFEANGNAKRNVILAKSDLQLPGDE
jgi:hypothetical protein